MRGIGDFQLGEQLEEDVLRRAIGLDVVCQAEERILEQCVGRTLDVLEVGRVDLEHAEAGIGHAFGLLAKLELGVGLLHLGRDLRTRTADALFADLADVLVTSLGLLVTHLGQLHHDEFPATAVLGVELHHGMSGCGGTGEEVENDVRVLM